MFPGKKFPQIRIELVQLVPKDLLAEVHTICFGVRVYQSMDPPVKKLV